MGVMSENEIHIPFPLDPMTKSRIKASFKDAVQAMQDAGDDAECAYIDTQIDSKLATLDRSAVLWVRKLGRISRVLHSIYVDFKPPNVDGQMQVTRTLKNKIIAALFYLVNPFDIIPDYVPGTGYSDDALVINLVVNAIEKQHPGLLQEFDSELA